MRSLYLVVLYCLLSSSALAQMDVIPIMSWEGEIQCLDMPGKLLLEMKSKEVLDAEIDARYLQLVKQHPELPIYLEAIDPEEYNRWAYGMVRTFEKHYPGEVQMVNETDKEIKSYTKREYPYKMRMVLDFQRSIDGTFLVMYPVLINRGNEKAFLPSCLYNEPIIIFELDKLFGEYILYEVPYHKPIKQFVKSIADG